MAVATLESLDVCAEKFKSLGKLEQSLESITTLKFSLSEHVITSGIDFDILDAIERSRSMFSAVCIDSDR